MVHSYKYDIERSKNHAHKRYCNKFYKWLRKAKESKLIVARRFYQFLFHFHALKHNIEIHTSTKIGYGLSLWHPFNITVAREAILGKNITLNKNCLIGREFRGKRNGCPIIGDNVWIGANAVVVGKIVIGNNVLIAPGAFVNKDVPSNSIVIGNPCIIKHDDKATEGYIQYPI